MTDRDAHRARRRRPGALRGLYGRCAQTILINLIADRSNGGAAACARPTRRNKFSCTLSSTVVVIIIHTPNHTYVSAGSSGSSIYIYCRESVCMSCKYCACDVCVLAESGIYEFAQQSAVRSSCFDDFVVANISGCLRSRHHPHRRFVFSASIIYAHTKCISNCR